MGEVGPVVRCWSSTSNVRPGVRFVSGENGRYKRLRTNAVMRDEIAKVQIAKAPEEGEEKGVEDGIGSREWGMGNGEEKRELEGLEEREDTRRELRGSRGSRRNQRNAEERGAERSEEKMSQWRGGRGRGGRRRAMRKTGKRNRCGGRGRMSGKGLRK